MKTEPAMSNCPIKSGIILEKSVCNDRALPRKLMKTCWCQEQVKTLQKANAQQVNKHLLLFWQPLDETAKTSCSCCSAAVVSVAANIIGSVSLFCGMQIRIPEHRQ